MSVAPGAELGSVLGVESEAVDVVGRGSATHPDDVVPGQVDGLPLDLVLQDGVDAAVQHRVLIRIEHFHGPDKSLIYHLYPLRKSIKMTVFKVRPLVGVAKRASMITTDLARHGSDAVGFAAPAGGGQGFWFVVADIVLLMWLLLRFRRRRRWFGSATTVFTVEMGEHLEPSRVLLYRCRGGGLSLGELEEPLVLRHQLVVVVVVVQVLHTVVGVVRQPCGHLLLLLFGHAVSVVIVVGGDVFVLPGSLSGQDDLHWWLGGSLSGSDTRSGSARGGRSRETCGRRLVVALLLLLLLLLL